jgi:hypothetical protein
MFVKPSTNTSFLTPYYFGKPLDPTWVNYVDQAFPNIMDGVNGGTYSGNLILTGTVDFSGDLVNFENGTTVNISTSSYIEISTGCSIIFNSGSALEITSGADLVINSGATLASATGSTTDIYGALNIGDGTHSQITTVSASTTIDLTNGCIISGDTEADINFVSGSTIDVLSGATIEWSSGSSFVSNTTSYFNSGIGASSGSVFSYTVATTAMNLTGSTTIPSSAYNCPFINITASGNLTGTCTIALPSIVGAVWYLNFYQVISNGYLNSQTVKVITGTGAGGTYGGSDVVLTNGSGFLDSNGTIAIISCPAANSVCVKI